MEALKLVGVAPIVTNISTMLTPILCKMQLYKSVHVSQPKPYITETFKYLIQFKNSFIFKMFLLVYHSMKFSAS